MRPPSPRRPAVLPRLLFLLFLAPFLTPAASPPHPAPRTPNFLIILADDMGFSDLGCYGGEIRTPNLDRLAAGGLRFTQFYNTARCWPTRSSLMTGYYAQQIRMDPPAGRLPAWARTLPQRLKPLGYRAYQSGKWHVPGAPRVNADGGFDHSYELTDHDRNFYPRNILQDDQALPAVKTNETYYSSTAFADHAIGCLREHARERPEQPFLSYLAFTVPHFPLQAPASDIDRCRERYQVGWDVIREQRWRRVRNLGILRGILGPLQTDVIPRWNLTESQLHEQIDPDETGQAVAWSELTPSQQRFQSTKMAIHAAMIERMDTEIGRVLDQLRAMGVLDDTVVFFASDNGASAEQLNRGDLHHPEAPAGSGGSFLCLGPGWSTAANSPLSLHKSWAHEGGIATPLIVHWPNGIRARGELRRDPGHVIDFVPTLLELAGSRAQPFPPGPALPGLSLVPAFRRDRALQREALFFNHDHNHALRMGDWKIVARRPDTNRWSLYRLDRDRGETRDLADRHPDRVRAMAARWAQLETEFRSQPGPAK